MKQILILSRTPLLQHASGLLPDLAVPNVLPFGQGLDIGLGLAQAVALDDAEVTEQGLVPDAVGRGQAEELGEGDVLRPLVSHEQDEGLGLDELVALLEDGKEEGLVELLEVLHGLKGFDFYPGVAALEDPFQGIERERRVDELEGVGDTAPAMAVDCLFVSPS